MSMLFRWCQHRDDARATWKSTRRTVFFRASRSIPSPPISGDLGRRAPGDRPPRIPRRLRRVNSPRLCTILVEENGEEERAMTDTATMVALGEDYPELRESVRKICERYPGAYWRKLEAEQAYPTEFITELTQGGFLASLIPEEYGGSGLPLRAAAVILEEVNASGCTASQGHAQM